MECITNGPLGSWPLLIIAGLVGAVLGRVLRPIRWIRAHWRIPVYGPDGRVQGYISRRRSNLLRTADRLARLQR